MSTRGRNLKRAIMVQQPAAKVKNPVACRPIHNRSHSAAGRLQRSHGKDGLDSPRATGVAPISATSEVMLTKISSERRDDSAGPGMEKKRLATAYVERPNSKQIACAVLPDNRRPDPAKAVQGRLGGA